ncbi:MAG: hypothetical protein EXR98_06170 [Gemmataceae bacterium]|nr:hypothetical protein [Gemmataceae bacterium]
MRRHISLLLGAVILLASASSQAQDAKKDKQDDKKAAAGPDYYPLQVGNAWHYRRTTNGKVDTIVTRISKMETINNQLLARLELPGVAGNEHLIQNEKGIFRVRYNGSDVSPPLCLLAYPAKLGAAWSGEFTVDKEQAKYTGGIEKEETIEVPADKFNTIRVFINLEHRGNKLRTTYWFAKDIGFVKQTLESPGRSQVLELEKIERKQLP